MPVEGDHYWRDEHGLWVENVGPWAKEKLKILTDYIQISSAARNKFAHRAFIDVFCGPGKSRIRDTGELIDGSPVAAFQQGVRGKAPFSGVYVSDYDSELLASAAARLGNLGAPVVPIEGPASKAIQSIVDRLNPSGLHLALLDPHNLGTLSFDLFEGLARLQRIDIIVHVSVGDLQRNVDRYTSSEYEQFDRFAPGWQGHVRTDVSQTALRAAIVEFWTEKVVSLGLPRARHCELIRGTRDQRLYWLMLLSRHGLAHSFWNKITSVSKAPGFDF
jgi:three-Cys-motif partner protein